MTLQINLNLLADNNGVAGEALTQDQIAVNDSFFVEIEIADIRNDAAGVIGLALDIEWDAAILEALDTEITDKLSFNQQGAIDNDTGLINDLGAGAIPNFDLGEAIGINQPERFALIRFQGELATDSPIPLTVTVSDPRNVAFADGMPFDRDRIEIEAQAIEIIAENSAPTLVNDIDDVTTIEDRELSFTIPDNTFSDADSGDSLSYLATLKNGSELPSWLTFSAESQTFSGTPDNSDVGSLEVKVTATDNANEIVSDVFTLTVANVDDPPTVANQIADVTVLENANNTVIDLSNTFTDIDNDDDAIVKTVTVNSDRNLLDASIDGDNLILDYQDNRFGTVELTIEGESNGKSITDTFTITVEEVISRGKYLIGGKDADELNGTSGNDSLFGGAGDDSLRGGAGDDFIIGLTDNDLIDGEPGNDFLVGYHGNDFIIGKGGDDLLLGNQNHDTLEGGMGNDILSGGPGDDLLSGGTGNDTLLGKEGADIFILEPNISQDLVRDFTNGIDRIGLIKDIVFEDLKIIGSDNAQIVDSNDNILMILSEVNADAISSEDFITLF